MTLMGEQQSHSWASGTTQPEQQAHAGQLWRGGSEGAGGRWRDGARDSDGVSLTPGKQQQHASATGAGRGGGGTATEDSDEASTRLRSMLRPA